MKTISPQIQKVQSQAQGIRRKLPAHIRIKLLKSKTKSQSDRQQIKKRITLCMRNKDKDGSRFIIKSYESKNIAEKHL